MRKTIMLLLALFLVVIQTSAFADVQYDTGHFTIDIPGDWFQYDTDTLTYFYGMEDGALDGRVFGIREYEITPVNPDELLTVYEAYNASIVESDTCLGEISRGLINVDDGYTANYVCFTLDQNGLPETRLSFLYYNNGNMFQALYVTSAPEEILNEFVELVESLQYHEEAPVTVHHFGSKHVAVKSWKVICQYDTPCLLVEYEWYHTEDDPTAFMYSISTEVYQDGIQCYPYIWLDGDQKDTVKIQKNTKLTCYKVYLLNNATSPVSLYVDDMYDFSDHYEDAVYHFDIAR